MKRLEFDDRIFVAGATTLIGSALISALSAKGYKNLISEQTDPIDLRDGHQVRKFFELNQPDYVFEVAGKSGGLDACRRYAATFMYDNLVIATNIIDNAYRSNAKKLLYLASSSCYPKVCSQPMCVDDLLTGPLDDATEAFAFAKIAGMKL